MAGILGAVGVVALAGCASEAPGEGSASSGGSYALPEAVYEGVHKGPNVYEETGVQIDPPSRAEGKIDPLEAYAADCGPQGSLSCDNAKGPVISLATVTMRDAGEDDGKGGIIPIMDHTLAYVFEWQLKDCLPAGGPPEQRGEFTPQDCTDVAFVDADTGKALYAFRGPFGS